MSQDFEKQLPDWIEKHFGFRPVSVLRLEGEIDVNFRIDDVLGNQYMVKISRSGQTASSIQFQSDIRLHLLNRDFPYAIPEPIGEAKLLPSGEWLRLQQWVPGHTLDQVHPRTNALRQQWGTLAGHLAKALSDFDHPEAPQRYHWNPSQVLEARPLAHYLNPIQRSLAEHFFDLFTTEVLPILPDLRHSINHNDTHEQNIIVNDEGHICGLIDFGDAMFTATVNELAIACAYAGMDATDPLSAMAEVVKAFHIVFPLEEKEVAALFPLIGARLLLTITTAAERLRKEPDNEYWQISAQPAQDLLERLQSIPRPFAHAYFRHACGFVVHPSGAEFITWARKRRQDFFPVVNLAHRNISMLDLSIGSAELGNNADFEDLQRFNQRVEKLIADSGADFAVGGYGEVRPIYTTDAYQSEGNDGPRWRTTHIGLDIWGAAGTPVYCPWEGQLHSLSIDPAADSYGPTIIIRHETDEGLPFYTLYGHLDVKSVEVLWAQAQVQGEGREKPCISVLIRKGQQIALLGKPDENGGWPPHLHFQILLDTLGQVGDFPGVAYPEEAEVWKGICPNPALIIPYTLPAPPAPAPSIEGLLARRRSRMGHSLSVSYIDPLHIVRGARQYLYARDGRRYLDTINNVAHVGHEHPAIVSAIQRQAAVLNTNTRYLHETILRFADELASTLPPELSVIHFVNSGSEATELALRMCEAHAHTRNMIALEGAYHGNTSRAIDVSHYKFSGKGGRGTPDTTYVVPVPDIYRGKHRDIQTAGVKYAENVARICEDLQSRGEAMGGFIAESVLSCAGQIVLPQHYLSEAYLAVRGAGGLCIADEVQVGLGRVGHHFWGFQLQDVIPDIVTIGKPLGNGHPLAAVACTPAVAETFANGMEYFNTFGGNPVSCAAGLAVLQVIRQEGLQERARVVGDYMLRQFQELQSKFPIIGDIRGEGLFMGLELVKDPDLRTPATDQANYLVNRMRRLGILMSADGQDGNVIKIKPPLCFTTGNVDQLTTYLDRVLQENPMLAK